MHNRLGEGIYYEVRDPLLEWDDIGGYEKQKEQLKELVALPLKKANQVQEMGLTIPTGVLIWGPLGTGVTMLAEAAARAAGAHYVYVSGREILGKPRELKNAFAAAKTNRPGVLYISDVEWLCPSPAADYQWEEGNFRGQPPVLGSRELADLFLAELDSAGGLEGLMLVGGSYRLDCVDGAAIKEKTRFNRKVFVPPPEAGDRLEMLKIYTKDMILDADVNIGRLAQLTEGFVGWDIENLCKKAIIQAINADKKLVSMIDFETARLLITPWLTPGMTEKYHWLYTTDCPHHYAF